MKLRHCSSFLRFPLTLGAVIALTTVAANADVGVTVNGSAVDIAPAPIVQAGRVFVPLRGVFEQLGASVVYSDGTINATGNGRDISLQIGSTQATVNGQTQVIDVAPFIVGASTYVPLRFVSEALGDSVSWDDADSIAAIDTNGGAADYYSPGTASYVDTAPPPIPVYEQPYVPEQNDIWQPGYWAWGAFGYYWVPGTWVEAPQPNYLWTPGYWQGNNGGFHWNPGYWAASVGFYGGVNYGAGYDGNGYNGGQWSHNVFRYNTYVTRVNTTNIRNVYIDRTVNINNATTRVSYNGGRYGLQVHPTQQQVAVARLRHVGMTAVQQQHVRTAEQDDRLRATVSHNRPPVLAVTRPLSRSNRPAGFVPVKPADRVDPLANVAPVHVRPATAAQRAAHRPVPHLTRPAVRPTIPVAHAAPPARAAAPVAHAPAPVVHAAVAHAPAPVAHAPAPVAHVPASVAHAPAAHAPAPVVHAAPVAHALPVAHAPAPVAHAHAYDAPAPVRAPAVHGAPAYHAPVIHEDAPTYRAPAIHERTAPVRMPAVYAAPPHRAADAAPSRPAPAPRAAPQQRGSGAHRPPR